MTPTPTIKSITLSDGTRLEDRGEVRCPKEGEWYRFRDDGACAATLDCSWSHTILSPVEAPAGGIERWGDWFADNVSTIGEYDLNPLIDAACAVVNGMAYTDPVAESALAKLAATLVPFTQVVKEERFRVSAVFGKYAVYEDGDWCGDFLNEQDAKAFASMKNQEGGE